MRCLLSSRENNNRMRLLYHYERKQECDNFQNIQNTKSETTSRNDDTSILDREEFSEPCHLTYFHGHSLNLL